MCALQSRGVRGYETRAEEKTEHGLSKDIREQGGRLSMRTEEWIAIDGLTAGNHKRRAMRPSSSTTTSSSTENQGEDIALQTVSEIPIWAPRKGCALANWQASQV